MEINIVKLLYSKKSLRSIKIDELQLSLSQYLRWEYLKQREAKRDTVHSYYLLNRVWEREEMKKYSFPILIHLQFLKAAAIPVSIVLHQVDKAGIWIQIVG
jgi:hypothetical protein